ncbi:hypothetical protein C2G38_2154570, partial [Gigaspora rosea]
MPFTSKLIGPCVITICKRQSSNWKTVTENVISKGQTNKTFPNYVQLGDTICLNCYNGIVTRSTVEFQQHALEQSCHNVPEIPEETPMDIFTDSVTFSQGVEIITDVLYKREQNKLPTIWDFEEFRTVMESKDQR